jgi:hypothetical protein
VTADYFSNGLAPISLAIAIQTSGISSPALAMIRRIGGMIQPLVIGDRGEAAVVTFDRQTKRLQDFTPNDDNIRGAVKSVSAASNVDQTRVLDAVIEVADRLQQHKGRGVLLLISESRDRGCDSTFRQSIEAVEREGIEVFGVHYSVFDDPVCQT